MSLWALDTTTRQLVVLTGDPASADHLPEGTLGNGRYACPVCGETMSLSRRRGDHSAYTPRFAHRQLQTNAGLDEGCTARADVRRQVEEDVQVVIDLHSKLTTAWPGIPTHIECPQPGAAGEPAPPPVIVAQDGEGTLIIECPHGALEEETVRRRIRAVRDHYGAQARHVWFFAEDPEHFRTGNLSPKSVRPAGAARSIKHQRLRPTDRQLQIIASGGAVYWVNGHNVLVPYGGHDFTHRPANGEDWSGISRTDWRISHPTPAPDANWWGLVPIGLSTLRRGRVAFHPAEAHEVMERLERSQSGRWNSLRRDAREQYQRRQNPPQSRSTPSVPPPQQEPPPSPAVDTAPPSPPQPTVPPKPTAPPRIPPSSTPANTRRLGPLQRLRRRFRRR